MKVPEYALERLLQEVKSKQDDTSTRSQDLFMDLYESMTCDYITKLTVASVFFSHAILGLLYSGRLITTTRGLGSKYAHVVVQKYNFVQFKIILEFILEIACD